MSIISNKSKHNEITEEVEQEEVIETEKNIEIKEEINKEYKYIIYTDIENIAENSLVIFTSEKCEFCIEYLDKIKEKYSNTNTKIYLVDMEKEYNKSAWVELNIKGIPYAIEVQDGIIQNTYLGLESFKNLP